jgi:hypothetical protein
VTGKETDEAYERSKEHTKDNQGKTKGQLAWQEQLSRSIRQLTQMLLQGNWLPKVGMHCVGQMAQVTKLTTKMVEIKFRGSRNLQLEHKLKRPNLCIMLETGWTMEQCGYAHRHRIS